MRLLVITLLLSSVAAIPTTSLLQTVAIDTNWLPSLSEDEGSARYVTAPVKVDEVVKTIMATGTLVPALNIEVGSLLSGQVSRLHVDFNDKVKKGQVLAELDDRSYALAVDASRAAYEGAKFQTSSYEARLKRTILDLWQTEHQLPVFQARADAAKITLETAERDLSRKQWLQAREVAAISDVQNVQARRDSAVSVLREAEANLANQTGLVSAAQADVDRARAELANAQSAAVKLEAQWHSAALDLERTKIRSPVDGIVVGRNITEGQTLATGLEAKTLFIIAGDLDRMEINTRISESDIAGIRDGQDATFTVDAFPGRTFSATVKQIRMAPQVLSNVVTYTVVLKTANPDQLLLPGMTVMANVVTHRAPAAMTVPMAALRYRPRTALASSELHPVVSAASVWVLRNGKAVALTVVKGEEDGRNVVVSSGQLRPTDILIVGEKTAKTPRASGGV